MLSDMQGMWPNTSRRTSVLAYSAFAAFVGYYFFVSSWTDLPAAPDPATGHVLAYTIRGRGILYVTQQELDTSHVLLGIAILLLVASFIVAFRDYYRGNDA